MKPSIAGLLLSMLAFAHLVTGATGASKETGPDQWRISCFAYRDDNRNGLYDMADRPYGGLVVQIERPDGLVVEATSNISGFANFDMSLGNEPKGQIYEVGVHKVKAVLPKGWITTSDAGLQEISFVERQNAGGRMVAVNNCVPIGVAPNLFIAGSVARTTPDQQLQVSITPEGLGGEKARLDPQGKFSVAVKPGLWLVRITDENTGARIERSVQVKSHPVRLSESAEFSEPTGVAGPLVTVSFDDLTGSDTLFKIPSGYGGLYWGNWIAVHHKFYQGAGYVNGTVSSEYIAYNSSGHPAEMRSQEGSTFDFVGTYISVAWPRAESDLITIRAWTGKSLKHTDKLHLSTSGSIYFLANYTGITKLEFASGNYERIVLDDFSFRK